MYLQSNPGKIIAATTITVAYNDNLKTMKREYNEKIMSKLPEYKDEFIQKRIALAEEINSIENFLKIVSPNNALYHAFYDFKSRSEQDLNRLDAQIRSLNSVNWIKVQTYWEQKKNIVIDMDKPKFYAARTPFTTFDGHQEIKTIIPPKDITWW
jgi:hypothetical protein